MFQLPSLLHKSLTTLLSREPRKGFDTCMRESDFIPGEVAVMIQNGVNAVKFYFRD